MKRVLLILLLFLINLPAFADKNEFQNIFITDTSEIEECTNNLILKGFAEYMENSEIIYLKDDNNQFVLNIKTPQKITSETLNQKYKQNLSKTASTYSKYDNEEYLITPTNYVSSLKTGNLIFGTTYENDIDYAQLEQTTGIFTKYDTKWFALKTSYEKTIGSTNGNYIDTIYIVPELKINKIISLKEALSQNFTYNRKKAEFIISINPFAKTNDNRLNFEFGSSHTYDENNSVIRNQLKFNTRFKL